MEHLNRLFNENFMEYASYVIKERAIPHLEDGLKPVQRRILQSLHDIHDGKFHKVANVVGHTMQYHPHGDASIYEALVALAQKKLFIDTQGNFGNPLTGDPASAARYIECRLLPLAAEILFTDQITQYQDSYDGRRKEPLTLPAKIALPLILGAEGIAVGMSTRILPHNFVEVIEAERSALLNKNFEVFPDFPSGGIIDVSDYNQGNGKIINQAKIDLSDSKKIIISELPYGVNTESLIASIESANRNNKIKIASISDYSTSSIEIEIQLPRGIHSKDIIDSLYAFTDCRISIPTNLLLVHQSKPVIMTVNEVIQYHSKRLVELLKKELKIEQTRVIEKIHSRTLQKIFIMEKIYKRIEPIKTIKGIFSTVAKGLEPHQAELRRDLSREDIEKLLEIPIRRISQFDIKRMEDEINQLEVRENQIKHHLSYLIEYAVNYLDSILEKYRQQYTRKTQIRSLKKVDLRSAAPKNLKLRYNTKTGYLGHGLANGRLLLEASIYDKILIIKKDGNYTVIEIPEKLFVGKNLLYAGLADKEHSETTTFTIIYKDRKNQYPYIKRCRITQYILGRQYPIIPEETTLIKLTTRENIIAAVEFKQKTLIKEASHFPISKYLIKGIKARGLRLKSREFLSARFIKE